MQRPTFDQDRAYARSTRKRAYFLTCLLKGSSEGRRVMKARPLDFAATARTGAFLLLLLLFVPA